MHSMIGSELPVALPYPRYLTSRVPLAVLFGQTGCWCSRALAILGLRDGHDDGEAHFAAEVVTTSVREMSYMEHGSMVNEFEA